MVDAKFLEEIVTFQYIVTSIPIFSIVRIHDFDISISTSSALKINFRTMANINGPQGRSK